MRQTDRVKQAARQFETDDDEARFNATLKKVAKTKVPPDKPETKNG